MLCVRGQSCRPLIPLRFSVLDFLRVVCRSTRASPRTLIVGPVLDREVQAGMTISSSAMLYFPDTVFPSPRFA